MKEKTINITNFIGVYDNYITKEECDKAIQLFENQNKFNKTVNRSVFEGAKLTQKQDLQFFAAPDNIDVWWKDVKVLKVNYEIMNRFKVILFKYPTHSRLSSLAC